MDIDKIEEAINAIEGVAELAGSGGTNYANEEERKIMESLLSDLGASDDGAATTTATHTTSTTAPEEKEEEIVGGSFDINEVLGEEGTEDSNLMSFS
mgnify:CR=1 FL=1